jgi:sulfopyruvate decarboxylase subunit alpha
MAGFKEIGVDTVCALPESRLKELYRELSGNPDFVYVPVTNEGEGVSIAGGVGLTGKRAVMVMENSGLRVACEALARLGLTHGIPVMMLMPYAGDFGEQYSWGIAHGIIMEPLLKSLRIPYFIVRREEEIKDALVRAQRHMNSSRYHVAVIFGRELFDETV